MSSNTIWRRLIDETCQYEEPVEAKAYFDKIISLWKEYPKSVCARVTAAVPIDAETEIWDRVLQVFEEKFKFSPKDQSELEVYKFIHRDHFTDSAKKHLSENAFEVSFYEEELLVRFYPVTLDEFRHPHFETPYTIACTSPTETSINLQFFVPSEDFEKNEFLKNVGFKTLFTWMKTIDLSKASRKTNSLLDKESYFRTYRQIREDYGRGMIDGWKENSNPHKVIFEDCGIAAYIQELISSNILPKPTKFVDIGCGNGLLVHLLNKIQIPGYGIDVRSRNVWYTTLKNADLRESTVNPQIIVENQPHFDADVDLLIGNHSDELTPWIPVMAAKLNCSFFLIPCCPFDFFGKYQNTGSHLGPRKRPVSQYESFFEWTVTVAERLGFDVKLDRLAIPSTKRLCIIGRVPERGLIQNVDGMIELMTQGQKFVARIRDIKVKNCQNIPVSERDRIAKKLFDFILKSSDEVRDGWHCGAEIPLSELALQLTDEEKRMMKDQDGGLQTFLRNHHQIFCVSINPKEKREHEKSRERKDTERMGIHRIHIDEADDHDAPKESRKVQKASATLRDFRIPYTGRKRAPKNSNPKKGQSSDGKSVHKTNTQCYMAYNHPDGCPLSEEDCRYVH